MAGRGPFFPSRRQFLAGAGALAGGVVIPSVQNRAWAQEPPPPLRSDGLLPDPKFTALRTKDPHVVGVRPYRRGGVHLALEPEPMPSRTGPKYIIHNYGHGGAGITLSWGCASVTTDHVATATDKLKAARRKPSVAILGTGVIGLTVATELRRRFAQLPITVYARDLNVRTTTSYKAGGQFEPSGISNDYGTPEQQRDLFDWLKRSRGRVEGIQRSGQRLKYGVAERLNYTLDHNSPGFELMEAGGIVAPPRKGGLPFASLAAMPGREYKTWLMNPTILLPQLVADLNAHNVAFKKRTFADLREVLDLDQTIVVNCTGYGAKELFGDTALVGKRGHLAILRKTDDRQFYFVSGGCSENEITYVFCRQNDIVVGGSVFTDNDQDAFTPADDLACKRVINKAKAMFSGQIDDCNQLMIESHQ